MRPTFVHRKRLTDTEKNERQCIAKGKEGENTTLLRESYLEAYTFLTLSIVFPVSDSNV